MEDGAIKRLKAKPCYEHLGGTLGCRLFQRLVELGWFEPDTENPRYFAITETGKANLEALGVDIHDRRAERGMSHAAH